MFEHTPRKDPTNALDVPNDSAAAIILHSITKRMRGKIVEGEIGVNA